MKTGRPSPNGILRTFHRSGGIDFFEPTAAPATGPARIVRAAHGLAAFFGSSRGAGYAAAAALLALILARFALDRRARAGRSAPATDASRTAGPARAARDPPASLPTLRWHALLLGGLWTAHFAFYEPENHESWTLLAALLVLVGAVSLPRGRRVWAGAALPAFLLASDLPHVSRMHQPMGMEHEWRTVARATRPEDLVILVGGIQNGKPLTGSLWMRCFLAHERRRTLVSLYDVLGVTQPEYWDRPYRSPAALQAALDSGRRAYFPWSLRPAFDLANASGLVQITYAPVPGDSLFEIRRIDSRQAIAPHP